MRSVSFNAQPQQRELTPRIYIGCRKLQECSQDRPPGYIRGTQRSRTPEERDDRSSQDLHSLSLTRAQYRTQAEYIAWLEGVYQVSQVACFREERRYKREGPLPITPEKHVVEDLRRKRKLAVTFRSLNKHLPREELAVWRLPQ